MRHLFGCRNGYKLCSCYLVGMSDLAFHLFLLCYGERNPLVVRG